MKPVKVSALDRLVEHKPILLLDTTRLPVNFISNIVRCSPGNISSKPGNKILPLELWLEILTFAAEKSKRHEYSLVQPQSLEHSNGAATLLCAQIPEWDACVMLEDIDSVCDYEYYLARPNGGRQTKDVRPFDLPAADGSATTFRIPTADLERDTKMLFRRVTVPDVIAWAERGDCYLCGGGRWICAERGIGRVVAEEWTSWANRGDHCIQFPCPLCIGVSFANEIIEQHWNWNTLVRRAWWGTRRGMNGLSWTLND